jgi:hypothetical protein
LEVDLQCVLLLLLLLLMLLLLLLVAGKLADRQLQLRRMRQHLRKPATYQLRCGCLQMQLRLAGL